MITRKRKGNVTDAFWMLIWLLIVSTLAFFVPDLLTFTFENEITERLATWGSLGMVIWLAWMMVAQWV